ncbi:Hypothetical protein ERWE_CDS_08490 [Ehrlichia ruminantium str. Welgevonden]|uniref:Uncharacterized protein n=1 Tax=Ehrlichia ruminantium (strain Welgevonden) TaxID=254945 RepID=A0A0H3M6U3_EHRRW|nr:Hypothetical protein ERWE_CDS_08490 [Ehrlichia ruminantium str. Welgevonden]
MYIQIDIINNNILFFLILVFSNGVSLTILCIKIIDILKFAKLVNFSYEITNNALCYKLIFRKNLLFVMV